MLHQWSDAGVILGNHTFSHADLNNVSVTEFKKEIVKGEVVTRRLMQPRELYQLHFRYPYTHTGDSEAKKSEIERFLIRRGYKVTPHTIDSALSSRTLSNSALHLTGP
ncbi:MAG: polysaccharide deacetylase family protein [Gammaproteobacteria bacterium]|nr:polysaccharide deacetylase family protein [Gammaproteobacteria bacterium]